MGAEREGEAMERTALGRREKDAAENGRGWVGVGVMPCKVGGMAGEWTAIHAVASTAIHHTICTTCVIWGDRGDRGFPDTHTDKRRQTPTNAHKKSEELN